MISIYSGFESVTALLDLAVTMLTLFWCPIAILVSYCGCSDDALNEDDDSNKAKKSTDVKQEEDGIMVAESDDIGVGGTENVQMVVTPNTHSQRKDTVQSGFSDNGLPPGWRIAYTSDGRVYFQNDITKETQWSHPSTTQYMYV